MNRFIRRHAVWVLLGGCSLCLVGLGMVAGTLIAVSHAPRQPLAELPLFAAATDTGTSMSLATGMVDEGMEGAFFLDFVTGELACVVLNNRTMALGGIFKTNVIKDLGLEEAKKPSYLMATGNAGFIGVAGTRRPASCVVYVCDENTGRFAGYGFMWDRALATRGAPQFGPLNRLIADNARAVKIDE